MAEIKIDTSGIKKEVNEPLGNAYNDLESARSILSSIKIPSDFYYRDTMKNLPSNIQNQRTRVNTIKGWTEEVVSKFESAETKNSSLMNSVLNNSISLESSTGATAGTLAESSGDSDSGIFSDIMDFFGDIKESLDNVGAKIASAYESSFLKKAVDKIEQVYESTMASVANVVISLVEGVAELVEDLYKVVYMALTGVASIGTGIYDGITYLMADDKESWESYTAAIWKDTMSFVAESHVQNAFSSFYQNTAVGQWLDENAFDAFKSEGIVSQLVQGLGYVAGIILTGGLTGIATPAVATVVALGKYTSESWAEDRDSSWQGMIELHEKGQISDEDFEYMQSIRNMGDSEWNSIESLYSSGEITEEQYQMIKQIREMPEEWTTLKNAGRGLAYGSLSALWEGLQWYTGAKLAGFSAGSSEIVNSAVRIGIDSGFNAVDTPFRTLIDSLTSDKTIKEAWEAQGGWTSLAINLGVGLIGSAGGEVFDGIRMTRNGNKSIINNVDFEKAEGIRAAPEITMKTDVYKQLGDFMGESASNTRSVKTMNEALEVTLKKQGLDVTPENMNRLIEKLNSGDYSCITRDYGARNLIMNLLGVGQVSYSVQTVNEALEVTLKKQGLDVTPENMNRLIEKLNSGDYSCITRDYGARDLIMNLFGVGQASYSVQTLNEALKVTLKKQGLEVTPENMNKLIEKINSGDYSCITRDYGAREFVQSMSKNKFDLNWIKSKSELNKAVEYLKKNTNVQYDASEFRKMQYKFYNELRNYGMSDMDSAIAIGNLMDKVITDRGWKCVYKYEGIQINALNGSNIDVSTIKKYIDNLPEDLKKTIKEINVSDLFNASDCYWSVKYNIPEFLSAATGDNGEINIYDSNNFFKRSNSFETIIHEAGHCFDSAKRIISKTNSWEHAMIEDSKIRGNDIGCTQYATQAKKATNGNSEDFAEAVKLFINDRSYFEKNFPNRYNYLKNLIK